MTFFRLPRKKRGKYKPRVPFPPDIQQEMNSLRAAGDFRRYSWVRSLWKEYELRSRQWEEMEAMYDGACHLCRKRPKDGKRLHTDHDHVSGRVRGLLCFICNYFLVRHYLAQHAYLFFRTGDYLVSTFDGRLL